MSEETKEIKSEENVCLCKSKCFRKFIGIVAGSFIGAYCALSLFTAINKPPMMVPPCAFNGPMPPAFEQQRFEHPRFEHRGNFEHGKHFDKNMPPKDDFQKPEAK